MRDLDDLFAALAKSGFRRGFSLRPRERAYLAAKGRETVAEQPADRRAQWSDAQRAQEQVHADAGEERPPKGDEHQGRGRDK